MIESETEALALVSEPHALALRVMASQSLSQKLALGWAQNIATHATSVPTLTTTTSLKLRPEMLPTSE